MAEWIPLSEGAVALGAEGNKEFEVDISQIEDFSLPGPSGFIQDYVNIDMGRTSGSSGSGSPVFHLAKEPGPADSSNEELVTEPDDVIKAAREAATRARAAVTSCLKSVKKAMSAYDVARETVNFAISQAGGAEKSEEADRHRYFAYKCRKAALRVSDVIYKAESVISIVTDAAIDAEHYATQLDANLKTEAVPNEQQGATSATEAVPNEQQGATSATEAVPNELAISAREVVRIQRQAISATEDAKKNAIDAYKSKYRLLRATKKLWECIESEDNDGTESTVNVSCCSRYKATTTYISLGFVSALGSVLIALPQFLKMSPVPNNSLIGAGGFFIGMSSAIGAYKLLRYALKRDDVVERQRRRRVIAVLQEQMSALRVYFGNNDVSPMESSSSESEHS